MKLKLFFLFALLSLLQWGDVFAQDITFSKETYSSDIMTLPYRKATIPGTGDKASLVIYLHGGTSKGNDNEAQLQEPGVSNISTWLEENGRKAIMIVPQCPKDKSWIGTTLDVVAGLLQTFIDRGVADAGKVYVFGGSMGGTGTWNMLASYPDMFAAAMPVAGNPSGLDAEAVAKTPLFTVMGTADRIMKISNVEDFLIKMDTYDAEYKFNIEEGWTHENVCEDSYTTERLNWVFRHVKGQTDGVAAVTAGDAVVVNTVWYGVDGQKLSSEPTQKGIYIKTYLYDNGRQTSRKVCKN